jgi:hypothetical protein
MLIGRSSRAAGHLDGKYFTKRLHARHSLGRENDLPV